MIKSIKYSILYLLVILFSVTSCIPENDPLVTVSPTVGFKAHIRSDKVYVNATINANPDFVDPGNIPTIFRYDGEIALYNGRTGDLTGSAAVTGSGLSSVQEVVSSSDEFEEIIIIASGTVYAYADKGTDGDSTNDLFLHSSPYYEEITLTDVINIDDYPIVTMSPEVEYQTYISNGKLFATATISAIPEYIVTGILPIYFDYDGVMQLYDEDSGVLLKSSSLSGTGLSNAVTISADTATFNGFIIVASGNITASANVGSDNDKTNDLFVSSAEFNEILGIRF